MPQRNNTSRARPKRISPSSTQTVNGDEMFGERLARLRKANGYTQTELGELLGISQRVITYYERETGRPPGHLLPKLAEALGVSVNVLLGNEPDKAPTPHRHSRLWRKLLEIEKLPDADRKTIIRMIDAMLDRHRFSHKRAG